jgi:hypothetical protein
LRDAACAQIHGRALRTLLLLLPLLLLLLMTLLPLLMTLLLHRPRHDRRQWVCTVLFFSVFLRF